MVRRTLLITYESLHKIANRRLFPWADLQESWIASSNEVGKLNSKVRYRSHERNPRINQTSNQRQK